MPVLEFLDSAAVRRWCGLAAEALGVVREQLNELNVFPVADSDTGTNLHVTMLSAVRALDALPEAAGAHEVWQALAHGVLLGAQGNSGVIVSQFLRGLADVCAPASPCDGVAIQQALVHAAGLSRAAVGEPVEGTVLTVASAGAAAAADAGKSLAAVARAAAHGARMELARTTAKLDALARAGVVDAGGAGLCVLLDALAAVVTGAHARTYVVSAAARLAAPRVPAGLAPLGAAAGSAGGPSAGYEVMYLLEAADEPVTLLRDKLGRLGNSLVVAGGQGLWNVHVHVADAGAAIEAGIAAGRPYRIRVTYLGVAGHAGEPVGAGCPAPAAPVGAAALAAPAGPVGAAALAAPAGVSGGGVVAVVGGAGIAALFESAGAVVLHHAGGRAPRAGELLDAVLAAGGTGQVAVLPDGPEAAQIAETVAAQARDAGLAVVVVPARSAVQSLAALAVHDQARAFSTDVTAMSDAAAATRWGQVTWSPPAGPAGPLTGERRRPGPVVAGGEREHAGPAAMGGERGWAGPAATPTAGESGQATGLLGDNVVAQDADPAAVAVAVAGALLADDAEIVTLITGSPPGQSPTAGGEGAAAAAAYVQAAQPGIEVVTYAGGDPRYLLLIGVE